MASGGTALPFLPFAAGIAAILVSGGQALYMIVGDALVFLAGIAFSKDAQVICFPTSSLYATEQTSCRPIA